MKSRLDDRHDRANPKRFKQIETQNELKFAVKYLEATANMKMTDQDVEISENLAKEFKHNSLMEYSNIQLDFIKVYDQRILVMVIGRL